MKFSKGVLLWTNWIVVALLLLCIPAIINMALAVFYHPSYTLSPYFESIVQIWTIITPSLFLVALGSSIFRKRLSLKMVRRMMMGVYATMLCIAAVILLRVDPVPKSVIHSVGGIEYQVPTEFTISPEDESKVLQTWMCIETLQGEYDRSRPKECDIAPVRLFDQTFGMEVPGVPSPAVFFQKKEEFDYDGGNVLFKANADQYRAYQADDWTLYTVDEEWYESRDRLTPQQYQDSNFPVHLQVDGSDRLIRFVDCQQYPNGRSHCEHVVPTSIGILVYRLDGRTEANLERWQTTDQRLLDLIDSWKVKQREKG